MIAVAAFGGASLLTTAASHVKLAVQISTQRYKILTCASFSFLFIKYRKTQSSIDAPYNAGKRRSYAM
jgi:hypothetical protein